MISLQKITTYLVPSLEAKGLKRRANSIFTKDLDDGFLGWLGLNYARQRNGIEVNPVIGIRCQEIEKIISVILQENPHEYIPPTISISLGYLMPEQRYNGWVFGGVFNEREVSDLSEAICSFGIPFMESSSSLRKINSLLESPPLRTGDVSPFIG
jgi:hypothetical protein